MLFTVPSTGGFSRKPFSSLVLKIRETKKLECIHEYYFVDLKIRVKNR
jgi:hypothetical protein